MRFLIPSHQSSFIACSRTMSESAINLGAYLIKLRNEMLRIIKDFIANYEMFTKNKADQFKLHPQVVALVVIADMMLIQENMPWWITAVNVIEPEHIEALAFCYQRMSNYRPGKERVPEELKGL